jgi:hypothetical protein
MLVKMLEENHPDAAELTFDKIEGDAAAVGDLIARLLMIDSLDAANAAEDAEEAARKIAVAAKPDKAKELGLDPESLRMIRMKKKRKLDTARGPIEFERTYLNFPDLGIGVFPPRRTTANPEEPNAAR